VNITIAFLFLCRMSRYHSYLNSAVQILAQYNGEEPFASFLKKFFAAHKKYGSTDRKRIGHLCYCCFRLGKSLRTLSSEERVIAGLFLCLAKPDEMLATLRPEWNDKVALLPKEKYALLSHQQSVHDVFPWKDELSEGIDHDQFSGSFFIQPDLFLRLRPGKKSAVLEKLRGAALQFEQLTDACIALPNASKIEQVIELNKEAVIQDYNSQQTGELLGMEVMSPGMAVWDCCAASGGKSIMVRDILGDIDLTVSDIRESILVNLKKRFSEAGIKNYHSFCADISMPGPVAGVGNFDLVICDVPCTGSGTWGRTPEQLFYFEPGKIELYAARQKKIVSNIIPHLRPGGHVLYSTCSVFKKENEEVVELVSRQYGLAVIKAEVLKGYDKKADTLFAALLRKPL
jgi:16S rRNA (cytosine967-C5)-methyltransferase